MKDIPVYRNDELFSPSAPLVRTSQAVAQNLSDIGEVAYRTGVAAKEAYAQKEARDQIRAEQMQKAADDQYATQFQLELEKSAFESYQRNQANPAALKKELDEVYKGFMEKNTNPALADKLELRYLDITRPYLTRAMGQAENNQNQRYQRTVLEYFDNKERELRSIAPMLYSGDHTVNMEAATAMQGIMADAIAKSQASGTDGGYLLTPAQQSAMLDRLVTVVTRDGLLQAFQDNPRKQELYDSFMQGELTVKIPGLDGAITEMPARQFMDSGNFNAVANVMEGELKRIQVAEEKQAKIDNALIRYSDKLNLGQGIVDPRNEGDRDMVALGYENAGQAEQFRSMQAGAIDDLARVSQRTGIVPEPAQQTIRSFLVSGSPEQKVYAAEAIDKLQQDAPQTLNQFSEKDIALGTTMAALKRSGIEPKRAMAVAEASLSPLTDEQYQAAKAELAKAKPNYSDMLVKSFNPPGWAGNPELPAATDVSSAMVTDFKRIYDNYYIQMGGNADLALKTAQAVFKRDYGVSKINGNDVLMKYPPEKYFAVQDVPNDWMQSQLNEQAKKAFGDKVDMGKVSLFADPQTEREANQGKPSYVMLYQDNDTGLYEASRTRATFDINAHFNQQASEASASAGKTVDRARRERERKLDDEKKGIERGVMGRPKRRLLTRKAKVELPDDLPSELPKTLEPLNFGGGE
jgi:hypothetical protein